MECRILPRLFPCFLVTKSSSPGPRKCLGDDTKVLLLGDSTTHGLLQEALTMWSEVKPLINGLNKSHLTKLRFFFGFLGFHQQRPEVERVNQALHWVQAGINVV